MNITNRNLKFNYYSGNIKKTMPLGLITLKQFILSHEIPSYETLKILDLI